MAEISKNALTTLQKRYFIKDNDGKIQEDWTRLCQRVSSAISSEEKEQEYWASQYFELIHGLFFIPNSPTLMNAGKEGGQLAACFVLPVEDDMGRIMDTAKDAVMIHKSGGGTGFDFSALRPGGSIVKTTNGVSSGPVSFMTMYNNCTEVIKQGGTRRGANMGILRVDHPDILEFIDCKQDITKINNFNISVGITDKFMKALEKDKEYDLHWDGKSYGKLKAKDVWAKITKNAWTTGEPGLFFIDTANRTNGYGEIVATNPCCSGDTKIATLDGIKSIKEISENKKDILVYTWNPNTKLPEISWMRNTKLTRKNVNLVEIVFDSGMKLKCTPDHNLFSFRGNKIKAKDIKIGQRVRAFAISSEGTNHLRMHGWKDNKTQHIWVHRALWELYNGKIPDGYEINHINEDSTDNRIENLEILTNYEHNSLHYKKRFENGFNSIGVNKSLECGQKISESLKRRHLEKECIKNHKVISVNYSNREDVYNGTVDNTHCYIIADDEYCGKYKHGVLSGIVSANCGEQPIRNNESCNLGSINVGLYVVEDNEETIIFMWDKLKDDVRTSIRFLDSVITMNCYPLEIIKKTHAETRKIGLGIMGFADALVKLKKTYGSKDSLVFAENLWKVIYETAQDESKKLGKEKGICLASKVNKLPYRNYWITTIAPTGTISIIANCSSGIEPFYAIGFEKNVLDGERLVEFHSEFEKQMGKKGIKITNELRDKISRAVSIQDFKEVPKDIREIFVTAADVTGEQHIKMQAVFQKYSDSGVSKTINLPKSAKVKDVDSAYRLAYKLGCKGTTVYRDGSRPGQVLSTKREETPDRKVYNRTTIMSGRTEKVTTALGNLLLSINDHSHGEPGEVILNIGKSGGDITAFNEALGRTISCALQWGVPPNRIGKQLKGIKGEDVIFHSGEKFLSIPDLVGKRLIELYKEKEKEEEEVVLAPCPSCGDRMYRGEGCQTCYSCGYSKC